MDNLQVALGKLDAILIARIGNKILVKRDHPCHPWIVWTVAEDDNFVTADEALSHFKTVTD